MERDDANAIAGCLRAMFDAAKRIEVGRLDERRWAILSFASLFLFPHLAIGFVSLVPFPDAVRIAGLVGGVAVGFGASFASRRRARTAEAGIGRARDDFFGAAEGALVVLRRCTGDGTEAPRIDA